ncbi:MAG: AmmeMemoRadiSam system protein B [Bacteriovoracaceae bacterium]|nr:AmmeMemoRadiSam system protein B [Bacteriovoracaceae bacterium]
MDRINFFTIAILLLLFSACRANVSKKSQTGGGKMIGVEQVGMWYPGNYKKLSGDIQDYIKKTGVKQNEDVIALICPHAGYAYSGQNAAYAFASIKGNKYKRVIVIGPSHYYSLHNKMAIPDAEAYKTVFGPIPIDLKLLNKLAESPYFVKNNAPFLKEHSTDNEVPFIKEVLGDFEILPIIMGQFDKKSLVEVANFVKQLITDDTLIVVSSDFTHYGGNFGYLPFTENVKANLEKLNMESANSILKNNADAFLAHVKTTGDTICGAMPIFLLLSILPNNTKTSLLKYSTSGEMTGDYSNSVSYLSFGFSGAWEKEKKMSFSEQEKKDLLKLSRTVLEKFVREGKKVGESDAKITVTDSMNEIAGGFVTLHKKGQLRGCIGEIMPSRSVLSVVKERTISAAVHDSRFAPVKPDELDDIDIEISILTPPKQVDSYNDIVVGKHGILLSKNGRASVFLPQVAPEQGWDLATTLSHLSMKAGLGVNDWKKGAKFEVFEAIVFGEGKTIK